MRRVLECCKQTRKEEDKDDTHTHAFARLVSTGLIYLLAGPHRALLVWWRVVFFAFISVQYG